MRSSGEVTVSGRLDLFGNFEEHVLFGSFSQKLQFQIVYFFLFVQLRTVVLFSIVFCGNSNLFSFEED